MKKLCYTILLSLCFLITKAQTAGLYINEVSHGPNNVEEYVEFVVFGTMTCADTLVPTVDLRGWIFDDNNGFHKPGSGSGIAAGCCRFPNTAFWAAVPIGTLILIYDDLQKNQKITISDDASLTDGNCRLVLPVSSNLLEYNPTDPFSTSPNYVTTGFINGGLWQSLGMRSGGDSFHTISPTDLTQSFHAVSWGDNTLNNIIYYAGTTGKEVYYFNNAISNNPSLQTNWSNGGVGASGAETPGLPNNTANDNWIKSISNNCTPMTMLRRFLNVTPGICGGSGASATVNVSGGVTPYTYTWSHSAAVTTNTATNLATGNYTVTITDFRGCSLDTTFDVTSPGGMNFQAGNDTQICPGETVTLNAFGATFYSWFPQTDLVSVNDSVVNVTPSSTITYSALGQANGCTDTIAIEIVVNPLPDLTITGKDTLCIGESTTLTATGANTYSWSDGTSFNTHSATYTQNASLWLYGTSLEGCVDSLQQDIITLQRVVATLSGDTSLCLGDATTLSAGGGTSFLWSDNTTLDSLTVSPILSSDYSVIVSEANKCSDTTSITVNVHALPIANAGPSRFICPGDTVVQVASGGLYYSWTPLTGLTFSYASNATVDIDINVSMIYTVFAENTFGCIDADTVSINVGNQVIADAGVHQYICEGESAQLSATGGLTFSWQGSAINDSTLQNITVTPNTSGIYTLYSADGKCKDEDTVSVYVLNNPVFQYSGSNNICEGATATLTFTGTNTYNWNTVNLGNDISFTAQNDTSFAVEIIAPSGCTYDTTVSVNVFQNPNIDITGPNSTCSNYVVELFGTGADTYSWSTTETTDTVAFAVINPIRIFIEGTNTDGCKDTSSHLILVDPSPNVQTSGPIILCEGISTSIFASGAFTYTWLGYNSGIELDISPNITENYSVVGTDANGCRDTAFHLLEVNQKPFADFSTTPVCFRKSTQFNDLSAIGSNTITNWEWNVDSVGATEGVIQNYSYVYPQSGDYTASLIITDTEGCKDTVYKKVTVNPLPLAGFNMSFACDKDTIQLTNSSVSTLNLTYAWDFKKDGTINATTENTFIIAKSGDPAIIELVVTDSKGCKDTAIETYTISPKPQVHFAVSDSTGCEPHCVLFYNQSSVASPDKISKVEWYYGDETMGNDSSFCYDEGIYNVKLICTTEIGCRDSLVLDSVITVAAKPKANFDYDPRKPTATNSIVNFWDKSYGKNNYWEWNFGDGSKDSSSLFRDPEHNYTDSGYYCINLIVGNKAKCYDSTEKCLRVLPDIVYFIPNAFTPNGDAFNGIFKMEGYGIKNENFKMYVFDRWGLKIFSSENINDGWDGLMRGDKAPQDIYQYIFEFDDYRNRSYREIGLFTLIR